MEFLNSKFIELMNDIGRYGHEKYQEQSFHARALKGDKSRGPLANDRTSSMSIASHIYNHMGAYLNEEPHDHFGTYGHQLAAVAFNAMMEFYFADLENEEEDKYDKHKHKHRQTNQSE